MSNNITRPQPVGEAAYGPVYDLAEVTAYRKVNAVSQAELAQKLFVTQGYVSMVERRARAVNIKAKNVIKILEAIEGIAASRAKMASEGEADLAVIYAARKKAASAAQKTA